MRNFYVVLLAAVSKKMKIDAIPYCCCATQYYSSRF